MPRLYVIIVLVAAGLLVAVVAIYRLGRSLARREPYSSFLRLRTGKKARFFRLLVRDRRVPVAAKALPFLLVAYLAMPFDLVPDFIPVLGYVDDVAVALGTLALVLRLTPRSVVDDLLRQLEEGDGG